MLLFFLFFVFACKSLSMQLSALWHFPDLTLSASFQVPPPAVKTRNQCLKSPLKALKLLGNRRHVFRSLLFQENVLNLSHVHVAAKDGC